MVVNDELEKLLEKIAGGLFQGTVQHLPQIISLLAKIET
jgi:hypothetical protein